MLTKTHDNYNATIVQLANPNKLEGLDNLVGYNYFGFQCLVSKKIPEGTIGVFIPALTSIDSKFLSYFNLYASSDLNTNPEIKGYIPKYGMVKAVKLKGNVSNGIFIPLEDLIEFYGENNYDLGVSFNKIDDKTFCYKYEPPIKMQAIAPKEKKVDRTFIPEHYDTLQYARHMDELTDNREVYVSQKLHGTSVILGNTYTNIKLPKWKSWLLNLIGVEAKPTMAYVASSRRVIKTIDGEVKDSSRHYYGTDIWTQCLERYRNHIPKGYIIYGEIIGWIDEKPIQKGYTYNLPKGQWEMYVYRVVHIDENGNQSELSFYQMQDFCKNNNLKVVPVLLITTASALKKTDLSAYLDTTYFDNYTNAIPLSDPKSVDEGIVIREDRYPLSFALKLKSPLFYEYESKELEAEQGSLD